MRRWHSAALAGTTCLIALAQPAAAQNRSFDVQAGPLKPALDQFARQAGIQLLYRVETVQTKRTSGVHGSMNAERALQTLLQGTGLESRRDSSGAIIIVAAPAPQESAAADDPSQDIIITAQKRAERIQDVPIAVTVLTAKALDEQKIEGGSELLRGTPNVSFTKTNFASYNFQIRGIGTQALSVTTDPAVAISFNSSPMIRNRLFEQEYFDVDRVEVLRGPQGTLYGRNATAGVVNMIPNLASPDRVKADLKLETGNYGSMRASAMLNVPLTDTLAVRVAGAFTKRDGYDFNTVTNRDVNGRDLWGARGSITWKPSSRFNASLVWEHFNESDNRSRTGKQLCHTDPGPDTVDGVVPTTVDRAYLSQACKDGSLYDKGAFGVPNGISLPWVLSAEAAPGSYGITPELDEFGFYRGSFTIPRGINPYAGVMQSANLRSISTSYDPIFKARNDVVQLNLDAELGNHLRFFSQTLYTRDRYYSSQDYARFQSNAAFTNTSSGVFTLAPDFISLGPPVYDLLPNGVFCDPQLGCSNRILSVDLNTSDSTQWSQEFRLQSSFDGLFNFNLGANYLHYKIDENYYVFNNMFTLLTQTFFNSSSPPGLGGFGSVDPPRNCPAGAIDSCIYIDPNPLSRINGQGHNYFRSWNVAETKSAALFGEVYWRLSDTLKLTTGLRYTDDRKISTPIPTQLLLAPGPFGGGYVNSGYPVSPKIRQHWGEWTGRAVLDWKPLLSFTNDTLVYASYSRGYKAGGTNSPGIGANPDYLDFTLRDPEFKPEFVNTFEIGMKNIFAGGRLTFNATAFYNDYKNYQISQIQDRATLNENFNAKTWGLELEATWAPVRDLRINTNFGYLGTRVGRNQYSIDVMNRTQGNPDWIVVRPWLQQASNCIAPKAYVAELMQYFQDFFGSLGASNELNRFCDFNYPLGSGSFTGDNFPGLSFRYDPRTDAPNGGAGFAANVGGKELPNAPHWTANIGAQYTFHLADWDLTMRGDYYRQASSWARVYNDAIDRLKGWGNANLALTLARPASDLTFQLYVKNLFNDAPITGTFLNSDDSGLTTNVFTLDPRIIGFSIGKRF